jgi:hypothetical protein
MAQAIGHAWRIGERQVAPVRQGFRGGDRDLAAHGAAVVFERVGAPPGVFSLVQAAFGTMFSPAVAGNRMPWRTAFTRTARRMD